MSKCDFCTDIQNSRLDSSNTVNDYRMTKLISGVSASSFAANMEAKQNTILYAKSHPRAALDMDESIYAADGLTGASSVSEVVSLQAKL